MKKQGLVADPIVEARLRHRLPPSRTVAPLLALGRILIPAYLRFVLHYAKVEVRRPEALLEALRDFKGVVTVEVFDYESARSSMERLNRWFASRARMSG